MEIVAAKDGGDVSLHCSVHIFPEVFVEPIPALNSTKLISVSHNSSTACGSQHHQVEGRLGVGLLAHARKSVVHAIADNSFGIHFCVMSVRRRPANAMADIFPVWILCRGIRRSPTKQPSTSRDRACKYLRDVSR